MSNKPVAMEIDMDILSEKSIAMDIDMDISQTNQN